MRAASSLSPKWLVIPLLLWIAVLALPAFAESQAGGGCTPVAVTRIAGAIDDNVRITLNGQVHPLARAEFDQGRVDDSLPLEHIIMTLRRSPEQEVAMQTRIDQMHNRRSPLFHQWLGAQQVGSCYGVADQDIAAVSAWLQGHGFKVDSVPAGKMVILFSGTAGQVRQAFHAEIHNLDVHGEKHIANMTPPQIPAALAPVIAGLPSLNNFFPKAKVKAITPVKRDAKTGLWHAAAFDGSLSQNRAKTNGIGGNPLITFTGSGGTFYAVGPQDLYTIYNEYPLLNAATPTNGAGQALAVVERTEVQTADVTSFRSQFGLPAYPASPNSTQGGVNYLFGVSGFCSNPGFSSGDEPEADLDLQWIGTTAPAAIIDFVACASTMTSDGTQLSAMYIVNSLDSSVSAISSSYGACESDEGSAGIDMINELWEQAVAQGQTVVVADGDSGDDACDRGVSQVGTTGLSVQGNSSSPFAVGAGGTDFTDAYTNNFVFTSYWNTNDASPYLSALSYIPEKAWNNSCGSTLLASAEGATPEEVCNAGIQAELNGDTGGISTFNALPTWQSVYGVGLSGNFSSTTHRNLPDVSLFASEGSIWAHTLMFCDSDIGPCDYSNGADAGALTSGGTSFVAPMFTGIVALINQAYPSGNPAQPTRQGQANYTLYALGTAEYGVPGAENTSTSAPSVYTCESNYLAINTYGSVFPNCIFYDINRTPVFGTATCVGANNSNCIQENNDEPCETGSPNCLTATIGDGIGLLSISTSTFEAAYPQSAGYNDATGLGSVNITNLVAFWNSFTPQFASTTTVTANPASISTTETTTLIATETAIGRGGIAPPLGTVSFFLGTSCSGTSLGTAALVPASGCTTSCNSKASLAGVTGTQLGGAGTPSVTGCFSGDGANDAPSNGSTTVTVTSGSRTATTTTVTSSQNPSISGQPVTFTATVSPAGPPTPTGTVAFTSNGTTITGCSAVALTSSRTAACTTSTLPLGTDAIVATYSGDANYDGSSGGLSQVVNSGSGMATTTALTSNQNPSTSGQSVTFTATVSPAGPPTPTGTVSFTSDGSTISGCSAVTLTSSRTAACATSALPVGTNAIVAIYSGDSTYNGSSGNLSQVVKAGSGTPTSTAVTSSLNPSTSGQSVTFDASVSPSGPPTPTGTVSFTSNGTAISGCSAVTLSSSLMALCTTNALAVGTDAIVAAYSGDGNYAGSSGTVSQLVNPVTKAVQFISVTPCRVVDTRKANGPFGGPELTSGETRNFTIPSGPCAGIPSTAVAYSLNVTVVPPAPLGYLTIWPTGEGQPVVSTLNSLDGRIKANAAIVPAGTGGAVSVYVNNTTDVVLDIDGYFQSGSSSGLDFYPLTPCRIADTRKSSGYASGLGSPSLVADTERDFPILGASGNAVPCAIPSTAQAYSLNFTAVPPSGSALGFLTVWPQGQARPVVSTLNDLTGTIVANAAIVPAGTGGGVAVYPNNNTDVVIDVNGYFAPPVSGGLSLYALTPCRVLDTRKTTGNFNGELTVAVSGSTCAPPATAQAYVFNATVVPSGDLGFLTLWPDGETQPVVSTLNALDGDITSNMAIVPNKNGQVDAFASGTTQLVMDISAYFAP